MNTPDDRIDLPASLRMQLRGLRNDAPPSRDLWDGIAGRIATTPQQAAEPSRITPGRHPVAWFAAAAVLALAVGMGWQLRPDGPGATTFPTAAAPVQSGNGLLVAQADAMAREYEAALREVEAARGLDTTPAMLAELDASADAIRAALAQAPDSRFLFDRLQRVYAQRLALTQRLSA